MEGQEGNCFPNGFAQHSPVETGTRQMSGATALETEDLTKERNNCDPPTMGLDVLTKTVLRLEDELEMLKKQVENLKATGNEAHSKQASPPAPETEASLLKKAKERCVALYQNDKYVALAFYMASMPSYVVTAGEPFYYNADRNRDVKILRFGYGFDENASIYLMGCPDTNIALLPADEFFSSKYVKQGVYGSEGYQPHWCDTLSLENGTRATIFGFDGEELVAKSGEVAWETPMGKYATISCSLGPAAIGSPVVDGKGVVMGIVVEALGPVTRFLTSYRIWDWMQRPFGLYGDCMEADYSGHSDGDWWTSDASVESEDSSRVM